MNSLRYIEFNISALIEIYINNLYILLFIKYKEFSSQLEYSLILLNEKILTIINDITKFKKLIFINKLITTHLKGHFFICEENRNRIQNAH